jgi:hypothetical protein
LNSTLLDRLFLFATALLAAWQVAVGINGLDTVPTLSYTIGFGVLLVAALLLIIMGLDVLESPLVLILSTIIPLCLSLGLVWEHLAAFRLPYLVFTILGFLSIIVTRFLPLKNIIQVIVLAIVHGIAGLIIFLLPIFLSMTRQTPRGFFLVGLGGAVISLEGVFLSFLKTGTPILSQKTIIKLLPGLLFVSTAAFVAGFSVS